jgi:hypothetical protein
MRPSCARCYREFDPERTPVVVDLQGVPLPLCARCSFGDVSSREKARKGAAA